MKIRKIVIVKEAGKPTEEVDLVTDLPSVHPGPEDEGLPQWMYFTSPAGLAADYVAKHFPGIPVEIKEL